MSVMEHSPPKVEQTGNVKIITFTGDKIRDVEDILARELKGHAEDLGACHLLLDFTHVEYLNSMELGTLIVLHKRVKAGGGRLTLFNLKPQVYEVFTVTRLQTLLGICREDVGTWQAESEKNSAVLSTPSPGAALASSRDLVDGPRKMSGTPTENPMPNQLRAVAFDLDAASLISLREAFPEWEIEALQGATTDSLTQDWNPGRADLLVVGASDRMAETLGLCRGFRSQAGRAHTPLLVLVPPAQEAFVRAALHAGANGCLVLPIHAKRGPLAG